MKSYREGRSVALFCYGISQKVNIPYFFALYEASDFDAIAMWVENETQNFKPIQMKEFVPEPLNLNTSLNNEISKLSRYPASKETVVVIHVNRNIHLDFLTIKIPPLNIGELWLMGSLSPNVDRWFIYGDLLTAPAIFNFDYPNNKILEMNNGPGK